MKKRTPLWVWFDSSSECNLSCSLCYSKRSHSQANLTPKLFDLLLRKIFLDETFDVKKIHLNWRGDPFACPSIIELFSVIENFTPGFPYELHTNGGLVTEELARRTVDIAKSASIFISIDGGTQQSHDTNRGTGSYDLAIRAARNFLEARGEATKPWLGIYQLDLGINESDYASEFTELIGKVDGWVRINPINPVNGQRLSLRRGIRIEDASKVQSYLTPEQRWWTRNDSSQLSIPQGPCFWAGNSIFVDSKGEVAVCLLSHTADGILGNLIEEELSTIIERSVEFRRNIALNGRRSVPHCSNCRYCEGDANES
jgi:radical SAM protein with 4Fe4S-binding SPASM domain